MSREEAMSMAANRCPISRARRVPPGSLRRSATHARVGAPRPAPSGTRHHPCHEPSRKETRVARREALEHFFEKGSSTGAPTDQERQGSQRPPLPRQPAHDRRGAGRAEALPPARPAGLPRRDRCTATASSSRSGACASPSRRRRSSAARSRAGSGSVASGRRCASSLGRGAASRGRSSAPTTRS